MEVVVLADRSGSRGSRVKEEVVVHVNGFVVLGVFGLAGPVLATVVGEAVVLSFIGDHRDGSGSRGTRRLVENHGGGS